MPSFPRFKGLVEVLKYLVSFYALLPLLLLHPELPFTQGSPLTWALNVAFTSFALTALLLLPGRTRWGRGLQRMAYLLGNTAAFSVSLSVALTGGIPGPTALASASHANWQEVATMALAAPGQTCTLFGSWLLQLCGLLFLKELPSFSLKAKTGRFRGLFLLPLALPFVAPALQPMYPFALASMAGKAYIYREAAVTVDTSATPAVTSIDGSPNEVMVLVIGESSSAPFWQINGATERTSPFTAARQANGELINFTKHMSSAAVTFLAVPSLLTPFGHVIEHHGGALSPSLVSLMRKAGKRTGWFSTQSPQPASTEAADVDFEDSYYSFLAKDIYDEPLVAKADLWLKRYAKTSSFLVLHTLGSHIPFENRYPKSFKKWSVPAGEYPASQTVGNYNNSILYTDYVLEQMMRRLEQEPRPAVLVYVSDHGEAQMHGVTRATAPAGAAMLHVPFMVWGNGPWRAEHPNRWQALRRQASALTVTHHLNLAPTLMHLAGLQFAGQPEHLDLLSPHFVPWEKTPAIEPDLKTVVQLDAP